MATKFETKCMRAATALGWTRNTHNGYFVGPIGGATRLADYDTWSELCEAEGIEV